jgi:ABC-2 type transport system permease protein
MEQVRDEERGWRSALRWIKVAWVIAEKDARIYFFKGPNLTFGLLLPVVIYWAFSLDRNLELTVVIPGLIGMAIFFGAGAIQGVSLPLEQRTGTLNALLAAPSRLLTIMLGKALAGVIFGMVLSLAYVVAMLLLTPVRPDLVQLSFACLFSSFCFSTFGLFLAAPFHDVPEAMPPATVVRIAMVFLSTTFTPAEAMSATGRLAARLMPLTYAVEALRQATGTVGGGWPFLANLAVLIVLGVVFLLMATALLNRGLD